MTKKKSSLFSRGYDESRQRIQKNPYYVRSCFNCDYYYQAVGDKEECCQNDDVLQYDMVVETNNIYCLKWRKDIPNEKSKNLFKQAKKTGRGVLD